MRHHFATFGEINQWIPLACFGRIMVVYKDEDDAERAKIRCDPLILEASDDRSKTTMRVYRSAANPLIDNFSTIPDDHYLRPPAIERNFLISPPGSPPVGWEPVREEPPNPTPLADDLMAALRKLQIHNHQHKRSSSKEIIMEPENGVGVSVYVEQCGEDEDDEMLDKEQDWVYGEPSPAKKKWAHLPTAMPPMEASVS
jgi:hypothetical protein